jgi:hypothetical protein
MAISNPVNIGTNTGTGVNTVAVTVSFSLMATMRSRLALP